jgi:hypothetical protein
LFAFDLLADATATGGPSKNVFMVTVSHSLTASEKKGESCNGGKIPAPLPCGGKRFFGAACK